MFSWLSGFNSGSSTAYVDINRHYYSRLTDEQKRIYNVMLSGIQRYANKIKLPARPINETSMIFNSMLLDNPLIFYVQGFSQLNDLYKNKITIQPDYKYDRNFTNEKTAVIMRYLRTFDLAKNKCDWEKELFVHDYCLDNFIYEDSSNDFIYSVLGPVLNQKAVCEGIAKFVKLSLDYLGVKSLVVTGKTRFPNIDPSMKERVWGMEDLEGQPYYLDVTDDSPMKEHAWNIVEIDGKLYHLDATFDLTLKDNMNRYDYFNLSDEDIKKEHIIISEAPACITLGYDYYSINSLVANSPSDLEKHIEDALKKGKSWMSFKLLNAQYSEKLVQKVMRISRQKYFSIYKKNATVEVSCNPYQLVFGIRFV